MWKLRTLSWRTRDSSASGHSSTGELWRPTVSCIMLGAELWLEVNGLCRPVSSGMMRARCGEWVVEWSCVAAAAFVDWCRTSTGFGSGNDESGAVWKGLLEVDWAGLKCGDGGVIFFCCFLMVMSYGEDEQWGYEGSLLVGLPFFYWHWFL